MHTRIWIIGYGSGSNADVPSGPVVIIKNETKKRRGTYIRICIMIYFYKKCTESEFQNSKSRFMISVVSLKTQVPCRLLF